LDDALFPADSCGALEILEQAAKNEVMASVIAISAVPRLRAAIIWFPLSSMFSILHLPSTNGNVASAQYRIDKRYQTKVKVIVRNIASKDLQFTPHCGSAPTDWN
jgi:hypothetical protein